MGSEVGGEGPERSRRDPSMSWLEWVDRRPQKLQRKPKAPTEKLVSPKREPLADDADGGVQMSPVHPHISVSATASYYYHLFWAVLHLFTRGLKGLLSRLISILPQKGSPSKRTRPSSIARPKFERCARKSGPLYTRLAKCNTTQGKCIGFADLFPMGDIRSKKLYVGTYLQHLYFFVSL